MNLIEQLRNPLECMDRASCNNKDCMKAAARRIEVLEHVVINLTMIVTKLMEAQTKQTD